MYARSDGTREIAVSDVVPGAFSSLSNPPYMAVNRRGGNE